MTPARIGLLSTLATLLAAALLGLALTVAEVFTGTLSGGRFPLVWWAFLAAYYVPATITLRAADLLVMWRLKGRAAAAADLRPTAMLLQFAYVVVVANHELLRAEPLGSAARGATVALAAALAVIELRWLGMPAANRLLVVRPFLFTACAWLAGHAPRTAIPTVDAASFVLSVFVATAAAFRLWWKGGAASRGPRVRLALGWTVAAVCAWGLLGPRPGLFPARHRPGAKPTPSERRERPNIVLIVLDTVSAASLSGYGYPRETTPRLDAFARRSVVHTNCLAPAAWTIPSHASLFTGLYPMQHGCDFSETGSGCALTALGREDRTLAEVLSAQGYATAAIVGNEPAFTTGVGLERGFQYLDARRARTGELVFLPVLRRLEGRLPPWALREWRERWLPQGWRSAEEIGRDALSWLDHLRPVDRPYFLFLNYMDTHVPLRWHPGFSDRWTGRAKRLPLSGLPSSRQGQPLTREEYEHVRALYDGSLAYLDQHLGRLLESLEQRPDWDRTWVVVTADHGDSLAEGRVFAHGCSELTQQVLHVPLIVRYPPGAGAPPGTREDGPVQLVDVAPTLYAALGLDAAPGSVTLGQRRLAMMASGTCLPRRPGAACRAYEVLVEGGWKYVRPPEGPPQLFDLAADRQERRDLAGERPLEREAAEVSLARFKTAFGATKTRTPVEPSAESLRGFEALGYIQ